MNIFIVDLNMLTTRSPQVVGMMVGVDSQSHVVRETLIISGILGVHAGIEALKTMNDHNIETEYSTG